MRVRPWLRSTLKGAGNLVRQVRWSIGIYGGTSPESIAPLAGISNPVLTAHDITDGYAIFVADPFLVRVDRTWHMFFEVLRFKGQREVGEIGHATSRDGLKWEYNRTVLSEPFHLSYPYVFEWQSDFYMVPESSETGSVRLYRASCFPERWEYVTDLLRGNPLFDSSLFHRDGRWWMFVETSQHKHDTLRLFHARELTGRWEEHERSPVIAGNPHAARPAGRVLSTPDRLIRFAQDCVPVYGSSVRAFECTRLTTRTYEERALGTEPLLAASRRGWNSRGMHHVDVQPLDDGRWIACVDGKVLSIARPREFLRWVANRWS